MSQIGQAGQGKENMQDNEIRPGELRQTIDDGEPPLVMPPLLRLAIWFVGTVAGWMAVWVFATETGLYRWIAEAIR